MLVYQRVTYNDGSQSKASPNPWGLWPMAPSGNLGSPPTFKAIEVLPQESPGHIGSTRASLQPAWTNWKCLREKVWDILKPEVSSVDRAHPPVFSAEFGNGSLITNLYQFSEDFGPFCQVKSQQCTSITKKHEMIRGGFRAATWRSSSMTFMPKRRGLSSAFPSIFHPKCDTSPISPGKNTSSTT